jgi:hypothetical protein
MIISPAVLFQDRQTKVQYWSWFVLISLNIKEILGGVQAMLVGPLSSNTPHFDMIQVYRGSESCVYIYKATVVISTFSHLEIYQIISHILSTKLYGFLLVSRNEE